MMTYEIWNSVMSRGEKLIQKKKNWYTLTDEQINVVKNL